jgi:hypothetical protein
MASGDIILSTYIIINTFHTRSGVFISVTSFAAYTTYSVSDMSLFGFLEEKLGTVAAWPTHVLRIIFVEESNTLTITAVAAFFYGNSIPLDAALSFYRICNDSVPDDVVDIVMTDCNEGWDTNSYAPWAVIYYDMSRKKHRFIDGPVLRVSEKSLVFYHGDLCLTDEVQWKLNRARGTPYSPH